METKVTYDTILEIHTVGKLKISHYDNKELEHFFFWLNLSSTILTLKCSQLLEYYGDILVLHQANIVGKSVDFTS